MSGWLIATIVLGGAMFVAIAVAAVVRFLVKKNPCYFGHAKRVVAIRDLQRCPHFVIWSRRTLSHLQDVRWICDRCPAMGEGCIDIPGLWLVENGKLVRDDKRWTAWDDGSAQV